MIAPELHGRPVASLGFYLAERVMTLWLLIVGVNDLKWQEQARAVERHKCPYLESDTGTMTFKKRLV